MGRPPEEDHEEDGRLEQGGHEVEDILFELLAKGVPESVIWGYHDGWDWDRLLRLFYFLRKKEIEQQERETLSVAIGAGSLFKGDVMKKFQNRTRKATREIDKRRGDFGESAEAKARKDQAEIDKLFGLLGAPVKHKGEFEG